ncbi:MAG: peptide ABC transporter substrate-binding protein [Anaerolineaceae bacterium]|nr:peptide ABC transporter substrate-binding protein [Anaerolineaceae bacterium]
MKRLRWQLITIFLTGLVVGILLLTDSSTGPIQVFESHPTTGGIYREGLVGTMQRLNPLLSWYNDVDDDICRLVFSSLVTHDTRGNPVGDLAIDWGISLDGMTYNFAINPDAKWHDGQPVTADDVIFTYELLKTGSGYVPDDIISFWNSITINPVESKTVQFVLAEAFSPFLDYLNVGILPRHIYSGMTFAEMVESKINIQPIGSGPFRFKELLQDNGTITGVVLENNSSYYGKKPYLDEVQFYYYTDSGLAYQAYQQGMIDGISYVSGDVLSRVLQDEEMNLYSTRLPVLSMVFFNLDNRNVEFLQSKQVRNALMTGLNRGRIVSSILEGQGIIANSPILYGNWAYSSEAAVPEYNMEKAIEMLIKEGYVLASEQEKVRTKEITSVDGKTERKAMSFTLIYPDDDLHQKIAEQIQQDWGKINVLVNLENVSYSQLIDHILPDREYEAVLIDINLSAYPDPDPYPFWDQTQISSGQNYTQWNNRTISQYLETARVETDRAERARLYKNFQILFMEELPALPLYNPVYNYPVSQKVSGVSIGPIYRPSDRFLNIAEWYMVSRSSVRE